MTAPDPRRVKLKAAMEQAIANEPNWHYAMTRPIPIWRIAHQPQPMYPIATDCSGLVIGLYKRCGLADPGGNEYDGSGWTGSLLNNGERVARAELRVGDGVIYADGAGDTHHVALVLEMGVDPVLCSHGQEAGPIRIHLSAESAYHAARGRHAIYVRWLQPVAPRNPVWLVYNGAGHKIGETQRPALWLIQHWMVTRRFQVVSFHRRDP